MCLNFIYNIVPAKIMNFQLYIYNIDYSATPNFLFPFISEGYLVPDHSFATSSYMFPWSGISLPNFWDASFFLWRKIPVIQTSWNYFSFLFSYAARFLKTTLLVKLVDVWKRLAPSLLTTVKFEPVYELSIKFFLYLYLRTCLALFPHRMNYMRNNISSDVLL